MANISENDICINFGFIDKRVIWKYWEGVVLWFGATKRTNVKIIIMDL